MSLELEVTGQRLEPDRALLACRIVAEHRRYRRCSEEDIPRVPVTPGLAHKPFGWRPTTLLVTVRR